MIRGLFDKFSSDHEEVHKEDKHEGSFTHELIAGAAAYQAAKAYNEHCEKEGKPQDHAMAKIETKGLDAIDKIKAKKHAEEQLGSYYDNELKN
ncbi:hypothetical protein INT45_004862 [Circinella minor]|uniref:CipC protein n=1 Tax=Circinella minor TaxID=1195481 RepID=A0A8H7VK11_9FUNG|nr:hypothetical protein INT45_004862 [Circinella minor]